MYSRRNIDQLDLYKHELEKVYLTQRIGGTRRAELDFYKLLGKMSIELQNLAPEQLSREDEQFIGAKSTPLYAPAVEIAFALHKLIVNSYIEDAGQTVFEMAPVARDELSQYGKAHRHLEPFQGWLKSLNESRGRSQ